VLLDGPRRRDRSTLRPDFEVEGPGGELRAVDCKGVQTAVFRLKAKLWKAAYPDVPPVVAKADGSERPA
jgi:hypothetical protein